MLKPILYPYKMSSQSAKKLAQALDCKRVYPNRNFRPRPNHVIINWGNSTRPRWYDSPVEWAVHLNDLDAVQRATNKLDTFEALEASGVLTPYYSTEKEVAIQWINEGHKVFCRQTLTGHSGQGIVIASTVEKLVDAPLYVKAVKKDKEYRVHVFNGRIIDYQQKKKKEGFEGGISGIRNHANGWIYARANMALPDDVAESSIKAVAALGLDFGAVDVCTSTDGNVYVFEVNTAPGLHGTTLQKYTEAIQELL